MTDSLKKSSIETAVQMIGGYLIGVGVNYILFPLLNVNFSQETYWGISLIYTAISYVRGLLVRRAFNKLPPDFSIKDLSKVLR